MSTRTRLPTNAISNLEDILALCRRGTREWQEALNRALKMDDVIMQARLGILRHTLAEIERKARDARVNKYEQEHQHQD